MVWAMASNMPFVKDIIGRSEVVFHYDVLRLGLVEIIVCTLGALVVETNLRACGGVAGALDLLHCLP